MFKYLHNPGKLEPIVYDKQRVPQWYFGSKNLNVLLIYKGSCKYLNIYYFFVGLKQMDKYHKGWQILTLSTWNTTLNWYVIPNANNIGGSWMA